MRKLIDSHGGLLRLLSSVLSLPWTGATWAVDGNGRAYNTPTLGTELLTNGGFDSDTAWTKDAGWSITGGKAVKVTSAGSSITQSGSLAGWYLGEITIESLGGAGHNLIMRLEPSNTSFFAYQTTTVAKQGVIRANADTLVRIRVGDISYAATVDNATIKALTLSTLPATVVGTAGQNVTAKPYAITTGTQAGVISHLDDAASPANFIIAYHNGTSAIMDKCVGGTYTNLVTATVSFVSDAAIEIRSLGSNQFDCYYNGSKQGNTATVSDAGIISNTRYGLFSTYSGNTFSEFTLGGAVVALALPGA